MLVTMYTVAMQMNSFLLQVTGSYYLAKRRLRNILIASSNCRVRKLKKAKVARRFWIRPGRCGVWWSNFQSRITLLEEWKENFRMSKQTFDVLCHQLRPFISKKFTQMRAPVSVEAQVAVTLYFLSDGGRMRKTANAFGLASCTVSSIVKRVTQAISEELSGTYLKLPHSEEEVRASAASFFAQHGFPQCIGAVDGTHIPISKPKQDATSYINRKGYHSINVQACVDFKYCFLDAVIKWPGSVHDARVFGNSMINKKLRDGIVPCCHKVIVNGEEAVPICILGDPAYPLLPYLMKEFAKGGSTPQEQFFGYRLSSARMVVECAFGRLKARFGILRRSMDLNLDNIISTIHACFVLHNLCEIHNEVIGDDQARAVQLYDQEFQPPTQPANTLEVHNNERGGKANRKIFMKFFE